MNSEDARVQAERIAGLLFEASGSPEISKFAPPKNLADLICQVCGMAPFVAFMQACEAVDPGGVAFINAVILNLESETAAKKWLAEQIASGVEDPAKLDAAIHEAHNLVKTPGKARAAMMPIVDELLPKAPPGRPKKIGFRDYPQFLSDIKGLLPLSETFLKFFETSNGRLDLCVDVIAALHPDASHRLRADLSFVIDEIGRLQSRKRKPRRTTMVRKLAEALAGKSRAMEPGYSQQIAEVARRLTGN